MTRAMRRMRKYLIVVACIAMIAGVAIGGTIAWLQDATNNITNTFTPSNITVNLEETGATGETDKTQGFQFVPSKNLDKDPKVTASSNVPYYVFVKVLPEGWAKDTSDNYLYTIYGKDDNDANKVSCKVDNKKWTYLTDGTENGKTFYVYYATVNSANGGTFEGYVLEGGANDTIKVLGTLTDEDMENSDISTISLKFTAYAMQMTDGDGNFDAVTAWNTMNGTSTGA